MEEEQIVEAEKPKKKKTWIGLLIALGNWAVILVLLGTCFYIYSQAEVLKTSPCSVCEEELGMVCSPMPKYVEDKNVKRVWDNPIEGIEIPEGLR